MPSVGKRESWAAMSADSDSEPESDSVKPVPAEPVKPVPADNFDTVYEKLLTAFEELKKLPGSNETFMEVNKLALEIDGAKKAVDDNSRMINDLVEKIKAYRDEKTREIEKTLCLLRRHDAKAVPVPASDGKMMYSKVVKVVERPSSVSPAKTVLTVKTVQAVKAGQTGTFGKGRSRDCHYHGTPKGCTNPSCGFFHEGRDKIKSLTETNAHRVLGEAINGCPNKADIELLISALNEVIQSQ